MRGGGGERGSAQPLGLDTRGPGDTREPVPELCTQIKEGGAVRISARDPLPLALATSLTQALCLVTPDECQRQEPRKGASLRPEEECAEEPRPRASFCPELVQAGCWQSTLPPAPQAAQGAKVGA